MNICHLVFRPDSLTYTVAKALSHGGHEVYVRVADPEHGRRPADNIQQRLAGTPRVKIVAGDETALPEVIDRLIVQVYPRLMEQIHTLEPLAMRARRMTLVTAGDRSRQWRQAMLLQRQELRRFGRWLGRMDQIAYKDGFYQFDIYGLFKSRRVVGFDVHSQFLHDEEAFRTIHTYDWSSESPRPILANFLGSQDPDIRRFILDSVRPFFSSSNNNARKSWFWHEYSDASPGGLGATEFLDVLSRSDFTLSPPGYSLVTHRPMEALLRGSIPVLNANELDLYDIGLRDGVNCIAVRPGQWAAAMERLSRMGEDRVIGMRRNIRSMLEGYLSYEAASKRMCIRLGVEG